MLNGSGVFFRVGVPCLGWRRPGVPGTVSPPPPLPVPSQGAAPHSTRPRVRYRARAGGTPTASSRPDALAAAPAGARRPHPDGAGRIVVTRGSRPPEPPPASGPGRPSCRAAPVAVVPSPMPDQPTTTVAPAPNLSYRTRFPYADQPIADPVSRPHRPRSPRSHEPIGPPADPIPHPEAHQPRTDSRSPSPSNRPPNQCPSHQPTVGRLPLAASHPRPHRPPTTSHQPPTTNHRRSAISPPRPRSCSGWFRRPLL